MIFQASDFTAASRLTEADLKNDIRSCKRKLDRPLRLLTKLKLGQLYAVVIICNLQLI